MVIAAEDDPGSVTCAELTIGTGGSVTVHTPGWQAVIEDDRITGLSLCGKPG